MRSEVASHPAVPPQGRVAFEGAFHSRILPGERWIRVYLPSSYEAHSRRRFPVLYVQDGQNAFTTVGDHVAFGWGNWRLDATVNDLVQAGRMREILMVAIDCSPQRYLEYRGPTVGKVPPPARGRRVHRPSEEAADTPYIRYSRFLCEELKPMIDREYRTLRGAKNTALLGSSMGGLCNLALAWEHPGTFGGVASLSGAFQVQRRNFLSRILRPYTSRRKSFRVYLDSGIMDTDGGDDNRADTEAVVAELRRIGWRDGENLLHFVDDHPLTERELAQTGLPWDKWAEAQTNQHNEFYWRLRVWRALTFLFPPLPRARRAEG